LTEDLNDVERFLDGEGDRVYEREPGVEVYSVTTILDRATEEPEAVKHWRENNDGRGDNADWRDIIEYKQDRGTFAHYAALSNLEDMHPHGDMWSDDEASSLENVMSQTGNFSFVYSIMKDREEVETMGEFSQGWVDDEYDLENIFYDDIEYFEDTFKDHLLTQGIKPEHVESVEHMFAIPEGGDHNGFGGQADLLYTDPNSGEHVVADLKTSSGIYDEHRHQVSAYAQAALESPDMNGDYIDRAEIWRIDPDSREKEIEVLDDHKDYWEEFASMTREAY